VCLALVIGNAKRMRTRNILLSVLLYYIFPHNFRKGTNSAQKYWVYLNFLYNLCLKTFFILRRIQRSIFTNVKTSSRKVSTVLDILEWTSNFLERFSKNLHISSFVNIHLVTSVIVTFGNFVKSPVFEARFLCCPAPSSSLYSDYTLPSHPLTYHNISSNST
jgi:hypothetical protein